MRPRRLSDERPRVPDRFLRLVHPRSGRVLAERLRVPRTAFGRGLGLMFRRELPAGDGMWIMPCNGIHMFFMRFAIDAVFLDAERRIVRIASDVRPWRTAAAKRSRAVLELAAGEAARVGLQPGHLLRLEVEG